MRRIFVVLVMLMLTSSACFGAVSDSDTEKIFQRLDRIDKNLMELNQTVVNLSIRVDGLDKRMDDLRHATYWWVITVVLAVILLTLRETPKTSEKSEPPVTIEDVKRLLKENDLKLMKEIQEIQKSRKIGDVEQ